MEDATKLQSGDSDALWTMRAALREAILTKRKEDRLSAWSKNRAILGEYPGDGIFTIDYVDDKVRLLKKRKISLEDYKYLPNALIQCKENVNAFLKVDQSLSSLIRDLSGNNPIFKLYAASCCCNIALGNVKACAALGKAIIPYLLTELESLNYALLDVCIWTIGNLCAGSDKAFSILHAQHCLKYLILLLENCDDKILPSVIYALLHYIHIGFCKISESEMVELVQLAIKRNLLYQDTNFAWMLALISSSSINTMHLHCILPQIVDYLYCSNLDEAANISEVTASMRILSNTLHNSCEDKTDIFLKNPKYSQENLCNLLNKLLSHRYVHIRKEALWLIGNLYNHRLSSINQNIKDLIPCLSALDQAVLSIEVCT